MRGSLAKPGPDVLRFGGNTPCVEVRTSDDTLLIIDCGTGIQDLGQTLTKKSSGPLRGSILISHTHWDHIQGFPFFRPLFEKGNRWEVYGPRGLGQSLRDTLAGQMQYTYFPITLESLGSSITYHDLVEGVFKIGEVVVRTQYLNHPALTLGYRIEADGVAMVYASDHEPYLQEAAAGTGKFGEQDARHASFLRGADLVVHDAQYTYAEYGNKSGWGHSTVEYAVSICRAAGVRRLALTHHDPMRFDDEVERIERSAKALLLQSGSEMDVFAAAEGATIDLSAPSQSGKSIEPGAFPAASPVAPAVWRHAILIGATDSGTVHQLSEAARCEGIPAKVAENASSFSQLAQATQPSLIILDEGFARDIAPLFESSRGEGLNDVPIVVVSDSETHDLDFVTDWLVRPFSIQYLRTRIRAWVLRNTCRWQRARLPANEDLRLAALQSLKILDTERDECFDRITRLASALFNVPVSLVTFVDERRQWFKSHHGFDAQETSRDESFCSHAILSDEVMVVPDTLLDDRFADHPAVREQPRFRFYAGFPLTIGNGCRVGTLCIVDTRPREFDAACIALLRDLGTMVERELATRIEPAA